MLSKVKRFYRAASELSSMINSRVDLQILDYKLSPIDKYLFLSGLNTQAGLHHHSYDIWRAKRFNKILSIYGVDYFKGKRVLELGSAHGDIGAFLAELGADMLCLEGRSENVTVAKLKYRNIKNLQFVNVNLEHDFSRFGQFDLIVNFGLLYHLKNVDAHLRCCFQMSNDILMETVVCDSTDPDKIFFCDEDKGKDEEALDGVGSRPSPFYVERIAEELGLEVVRYFDADLNCGNQFLYDWKHNNDNRLGDDWRLRRFWRFKKPSQGTT
ncbi:class I SAM-dependent methyltransferase [Bradyrhizobium sp.]|uniref:class I SAM-dependent methyltransferase n=1 Tax=Bradyrhizobium sp. TaxID=376 RepID=UPI0039E63174